MLILLLSLIGQGIAGILMACDMHHDDNTEVQIIDHSMMSHHESNHQHDHAQPSHNEVKHDCCDDDASCLMSSCVAASYLIADSQLMAVHRSSDLFLDQNKKHTQTAIITPYRPPIIA